MAITAGILAVSSVGATVYSIDKQQQQAAKQEEANDLSKAQNRLQQQESIRKSVAASRVARARAEAAGAGSGASVSTTSGAAGAEATGTASNVGFALGMNRLQNQKFDTLVQANELGNEARTAQGFAALAGTGPYGEGFAGLVNAGSALKKKFGNKDGGKT